MEETLYNLVGISDTGRKSHLTNFLKGSIQVTPKRLNSSILSPGNFSVA